MITKEGDDVKMWKCVPPLVVHSALLGELLIWILRSPEIFRWLLLSFSPLVILKGIRKLSFLLMGLLCFS